MALTTLVTCPKFWADGNPHDKLSYKSWQWLERENRLVAMAIGMAMAESQLILGETGLGIRCGRWIFGLHWVFSLTCWLPWAGIRVKRDSNFVISPAETVWEWLRMYPSTIFHHILENPKKPRKWWILSGVWCCLSTFLRIRNPTIASCCNPYRFLDTWPWRDLSMGQNHQHLPNLNLTNHITKLSWIECGKRP